VLRVKKQGELADFERESSLSSPLQRFFFVSLQIKTVLGIWNSFSSTITAMYVMGLSAKRVKIKLK
jgi:hypothetical protein